jgi:hypothetical protein
MRDRAYKNQSFFLAGDCKDPAYRIIRDDPYYAGGRAFVESIWSRYHDLNLADPHFRQDARNHFLERFWEMYLAVALCERGFQLKPAGGKGPEFYFMHQGREVWVEAVAPGPGEGDDRVPGHSYGKFEDGLKVESTAEEKILLRFTNALDSKKRKYCIDLEKGIIAPDDLYIIAINSRGIPEGWDVDIMPYFVKAFLGLGTPACKVDLNTGKIVETFYHRRENIGKASGEPMPTTAGLDPAFSFVSVVLHSGVDCVNRPAILGEDFSILHWPAASPSHRLDPSIFSRCEQIFYQNDELERRPKEALQN